eukprot:6192120-Pyramimonas_sp.AAC.1
MTAAAHHRLLAGSLAGWRAASGVVTQRACQLSLLGVAEGFVGVSTTHTVNHRPPCVLKCPCGQTLGR